MRLTLELPEWALDRPIYIMAGNENVAVLCEGKLWVKLNRCNYCGKCCIYDKPDDMTKSGTEVGWDESIFVCKHLKKETWHFEPFNGQTVYICTAGAQTPLTCCTGPSPACGKERFKEKLPDCILEYEIREG